MLVTPALGLGGRRSGARGQVSDIELRKRLQFRNRSDREKFPVPPVRPSQPSPRHPLSGSCLCGGVRFELTAPFLWANYCHCSRCRKHSGAFGGTQGRVPRKGFRLLAGEELIRTFRPADGRVKAFCSVCGSSLFGGEWPEGDEVAIRFGALDGDPGIRPQFHTFVGSRAPWGEMPDDDLPRYDEGYR